MVNSIFQSIFRRLAGVLFLLLLILFGSALVYYLVGGRSDSFFDCLYMTFITITTIGYGEVTEYSMSAGGGLSRCSWRSAASGP